MNRFRANTSRAVNDAASTDAVKHQSHVENHLVAFDPARHLDYDSTALWNERYPDPAERHVAQAAIVNEALQAPVSPSGLYMQFVGGRGDGMRLIRQLVAKNRSATYFAFPISDPEAIAIVGEGRYFKPIYSMDPLVLCHCLPLRAETRGKLPPLNGLVRRLREQGTRR